MQKLYQSHNLDKVLKSEPEIFPDAPKEALDTWKQLGPLKIDEILSNSRENLDIDLT